MALLRREEADNDRIASSESSLVAGAAQVVRAMPKGIKVIKELHMVYFHC